MSVTDDVTRLKTIRERLENHDEKCRFGVCSVNKCNLKMSVKREV